MVSIVTGNINSGKTTRMLAHYLATKTGDGFLSLKIMKDGLVMGYDSLWLSTMLEKPLIIRAENCSPQTLVACQIGPYCFLEETMNWINQAIDTMILNHVSPIYLDEIGGLELAHSGFESILTKLLASSLDLVIAVRSELVEDVMTHFHIKDVTFINH